MTDSVVIHPWTRMTWHYAFMVEHGDINCLSQQYAGDVYPISKWLEHQVGQEGTHWAFSIGRAVHSHTHQDQSHRPVRHMTFLSSRDHVILYRLAWGGIVSPHWR